MPRLSASELSKALCEYLTLEIAVAPSGDGVLALLPMTDIYGDSVELFIQASESGYLLTDGGYAHHELSAALGTSRADAEIWQRVSEVAAHCGVAFDGGELNAHAEGPSELGAMTMALAQAVAESMSLCRVAVPPVAVQFAEEVELFFNDNKIVYEAGHKLLGTSGARHRIDFMLRNGAVHVAQAIASEQSLRRSLNIFYDVTDKVGGALRPLAFIDDAKTYSNASFQQLAYKASVFEWARRSDFLRYWEGLHK